MSMSIMFLALVSVLGIGSSNSCSCRPAAEDDWAHGANESVQYSAKAVNQIRGKVMLPNGEPIPEAVVEVYEYAARDKSLEPYNLAESKKRKTACLTNEEGEFCFVRLPAGKYVLKVGTRKPQGINNAYIIVNLIPRLHGARKLEISLNLGT